MSPRLRNLGLSVGGGLLTALAFPNPLDIRPTWSGGGLVLLSLVPLLAVREEGGGWRAGRWGLFFGAAYFGLSVYWIARMPALGALAPWVWLLLTLYLALYPALFMVGYQRLLARGWPPWAAAAALWVGLEFLRNAALSGFPWASLGYACSGNPILMRLAPVTGVWGLSLLVVLSNAALQRLLASRWPAWRGMEAAAGEPGGRPLRIAWRPAAAAGLILAAATAGGMIWEEARRAREPESGTIRVAALQGNIDQNQTWDEAYQRRTLEVYARLAEDAAARGAGLVVWPESAFPGIFNWDRSLADRVRAWSRRFRLVQLVGADTIEPTDQRGFRYLNSVVWLDANGDQVGRVSKHHLVPFGEYVPFRETWLAFLRKVVDRYGAGHFSPGPPPRPLPGVGTPTVRPGVLVCFESLFPAYAASLARQGVNLLVVVTNDTWFQTTSAPGQHAWFSALRAAENDRWLVRAAATGYSCLYDPRGGLRAYVPLNHENLLVGDVTLRAGVTWYARCGPWLAWICLGAALLGCLWPGRRTPIPPAGEMC